MCSAMPTLSQLDADGLSRLKVKNLQRILDSNGDAFGTLVRDSLLAFGSPSLLSVSSLSSEDGMALAQHLERTVTKPIADDREEYGASVLQAHRVVRRILAELPLPLGVDARDAEASARLCEMDVPVRQSTEHRSAWLGRVFKKVRHQPALAPHGAASQLLLCG